VNYIIVLLILLLDEYVGALELGLLTASRGSVLILILRHSHLLLDSIVFFC